MHLFFTACSSSLTQLVTRKRHMLLPGLRLHTKTTDSSSLARNVRMFTVDTEEPPISCSCEGIIKSPIVGNPGTGRFSKTFQTMTLYCLVYAPRFFTERTASWIHTPATRKYEQLHARRSFANPPLQLPPDAWRDRVRVIFCRVQHRSGVSSCSLTG